MTIRKANATPRVALLSISPGEMELTRMPCSLPSNASSRVMPTIPALFVGCDSDASCLKLSDPFSEAMFTTTPPLAFRCGHATRVREKTRAPSSRRAAVPVLVGDVLERSEVRPGSKVEQHVD